MTPQHPPATPAPGCHHDDSLRCMHCPPVTVDDVRPAAPAPCTCPAPCHAAFHKKKPCPIDQFKDCNGIPITNGNVCRYVHPKHPDREQPLHTASYEEGEWYWKMPDGTRRHVCRSGRFNSERFEIIS